MRSSPVFFILIGLLILMDIYVFHALKTILQSLEARLRLGIYIAYWVLSIGAVLALVLLPFLNTGLDKTVRSVSLAVVMALFFGKAVTSVFLLVDDVRRGVQWTAAKLTPAKTEAGAPVQSEPISRSLFLSWLGVAAGGSLFGSLVYGFSNKYNYQVIEKKLHFPHLPAAFKGLRVVHISDIHCGSFNNKAAVAYGVEKILALKPDLILFTGDLVNNKAEELQGYLDTFSRLQAPLGVYSVLGNHDYGDYVQWESGAHKAENLERLKEMQASMGWQLLLNEHVVLRKGADQIALLGVENWGAKANFPRYGRLAQAYTGVERVPFKILMSHDPSHWDAEVRPRYGDIDLTLSGHTHGMQFGVEMPWLRWSPVQYVYRQWAGVYRQGRQKLYVNRGFGFIGYPGRVGILPEITLLELA